MGREIALGGAQPAGKLDMEPTEGKPIVPGGCDRNRALMESRVRAAPAIVRGDAARLPLADASVDLIVTSPPYFALRSYQDGDEHYEGQIGSEDTPQAFLEALWAVTAECRRVLKPTGSLFVNLGDKYAGSGGHNNAGISSKSTLRGNGHVGGVGKAGPQKIKTTRRSAPDAYNKATIGGARSKSLMGLPWRYAIGCIDQGWILRAEIIWSKPNGLPESVRDRVRRSHEQWFHLTREGTYFAAIDEVREPYSDKTWTTVNASTACASANHDSQHAGHRKSAWAADQGLTRGETMNALGKLPSSVWEIATEPLVIPETVRRQHELPDHYAAFPQEAPRRFVLGWCPPGGVVLDPFSGTGTVVGVARALGRVGVGVDLSNDYCRLAQWRVARSGHFAKTASRTDAERQTEMML